MLTSRTSRSDSCASAGGSLFSFALLAVAMIAMIAMTLFIGCDGEGDPAGRDGGTQGDAGVEADAGLDAAAWCAARDAEPGRPPNLWLAEVVSFDPQPAGERRTSQSDPGIFGDDHVPVQNDRAFGPPDGTGCGAGSYDVLAVGINGSVTLAFAPGYHIYDGPGADFITFEGRFAWSCYADQMVNELAHVQVSADASRWYENADEAYDVNPDPDQDNPGYVHAHVRGLHGKSPTWANPEEILPAQELVDGRWEDLPGVWVCPAIDPRDPYLGGDRFDLATFRALDDGSRWPPDGRMRYLRLIDDDTILDGQDYAKAWSTGAHVQAALGIHVAPD